MFSIAEYLSQKHEVDFFWDRKEDKDKAEEFFALNLDKVRFTNNIFARTGNLLEKYRITSQYDIIFYVTDGSIFLSGARKNFLIIHSPAHFPKKDFVTRLKLRTWNPVCYGEFIGDLIRKKLHKKAKILPPGIDTDFFTAQKKEKIILSVGRFFLYPHNKKQDILVKVFKNMVDEGLEDWKLVLAGGLSEDSGKDYVTKLKKDAASYPIVFEINSSSAKLQELYGKAGIYWHGAGYGEDLYRFPEKAEHFGITTVEAMSAGCAPVVFDGGGQKELVEDKINGFLFDTENTLKEKSLFLINNPDKLKEFSLKARSSSLNYSYPKFHEKIDNLIKN